MQSFFSKWWGVQSPSLQALVKQLVAGGQLDFINGGWVQHDEATTHYSAMIDQTTRGHR
jgi:alpha-mannosidase